MAQYEAAASFGSAIVLAPDDATTHYLRGVCSIKLQQYDDAIADFSVALELERDYAAAYSQRGRLYSSLGSYAAGIADLDTALELDPADSEAYSSRVDALRASQDKEGTLELLVRYLVRFPPFFTQYPSKSTMP